MFRQLSDGQGRRAASSAARSHPFTLGPRYRLNGQRLRTVTHRRGTLDSRFEADRAVQPAIPWVRANAPLPAVFLTGTPKRLEIAATRTKQSFGVISNRNKNAAFANAMRRTAIARPAPLPQRKEKSQPAARQRSAEFLLRQAAHSRTARNFHMRFTPRQLVVRAREAAHLLLATLDHEAHVPHFLLAYANDYDRPGLISQPMLYRDLTTTIRRESVLAMLTHLDTLLPRRLGLATAPTPKKQKPPKAKSRKSRARGRAKKKPAPKLSARDAARQVAADQAMLNLFREEFFVAIGQALRWSESEFAEFARDYDLYQAITARQRATPAPRGSKAVASGPFVDRCGLLLDPSLLEQARRAAGRFQEKLNAVTEDALKRVFSSRREN